MAQSNTINQRISTIDEFLSVISSLDSSILQVYTCSVLLYQNQLKFEDIANINGSRFIILFNSNVRAFRTFGIFAIQWINNSNQFVNHLAGIETDLKPLSWEVQLCYNIIFDSTMISDMYQSLVDWMKFNVPEIKDSEYQIEYKIHPAPKQNLSPQEVKTIADKIPDFQTCINQALCIKKPNIGLPPFNYDVAIYHKRPRNERRQRQSTLDKPYSVDK